MENITRNGEDHIYYWFGGIPTPKEEYLKDLHEHGAVDYCAGDTLRIGHHIQLYGTVSALTIRDGKYFFTIEPTAVRGQSNDMDAVAGFGYEDLPTAELGGIWIQLDEEVN